MERWTARALMSAATRQHKTNELGLQIGFTGAQHATLLQTDPGERGCGRQCRSRPFIIGSLLPILPEKNEGSCIMVKHGNEMRALTNTCKYLNISPSRVFLDVNTLRTSAQKPMVHLQINRPGCGASKERKGWIAQFGQRAAIVH